MALSVNLSNKQILDLINDQYIETKITQCESFIDDLSGEEDEHVINIVQQELDQWIDLQNNLQNHIK